MIGRQHHVVIDCPDPSGLAAFYSELLGLPVTYESPDWVVVAENAHASGFAFQRPWSTSRLGGLILAIRNRSTSM